MAICRLMVLGGMNGAAQYGEGCVGDYDLNNLIEGRDFARWLLQEGLTSFPHDSQINCRIFIKWATHKINRVQGK